MNNIFKILFFTFLLQVNTDAFALKTEHTVPISNYALPLVTVIVDDKPRSPKYKTIWRAFRNEGVYSVGLYRLNKSHAEKLLNIARKAKESYSEIIKAGRCPNSPIKSDRLGSIKSKGNSMGFQVECNKNNIMLNITMSDEYVINFLSSKVEWQELETLALDILSYYK